MTVRLTVDSAAWRRHVRSIVDTTPGLVPVVKGNGYGFGRQDLAAIAIELADTFAVGTIHELDGLPDGATPVVLTPTLQPPEDTGPILTVGSTEHIDALNAWPGRVIVKLASSMHRYGGGIELVDAARAIGLGLEGVAIHPPLAGDDRSHRAEIEAWLDEIDPALDVWVSHLSPAEYAALPTSHRYRLRLGTALWHGDKSALHLEAAVLQTNTISAGTAAGYRLVPVPVDGTLVMIGAGTANGVHPLPGGHSPFHHDRRRLELVEPPHMHTSMVFVPDGDACPAPGAWVDLQRPLTTTLVDETRWS
ncbi:MAG: alanine racemase [Ilumatobacteraceae bacterium]